MVPVQLEDPSQQLDVVFEGLGGHQGVINVELTPWPGLLLCILSNSVVARASIQQTEGCKSELE